MGGTVVQYKGLPPSQTAEAAHNATVADLSTGLLQLLEPLREVPEPRPGRDGVGSKDPHTVQRRVFTRLCRYPPPHHLVLLQLPE